MRIKYAGLAITILMTCFLPSRSQEQSKGNPLQHLSLMGFRLGKNTIADVQAKLGNGSVGRCPDEEGGNNDVCYVSVGPDRTAVVFESSDFEGSTPFVDGFKVIAGSRSLNCKLQCLTSKAFGSNVATDGGLKLGLGRTEVLNLLGAPVRESGNSLSFEWQSRIRMTRQDTQKTGETSHPYWNVAETIDVALTNSKVVEFEIGRAVSD
jgi:hypothetical protein